MNTRTTFAPLSPFLREISINEELTRPSFKIRVNNPEGLPEWTNEAAGEYAKACILWPMSVKFLSLISGLKCNGSLDGKKFT